MLGPSPQHVRQRELPAALSVLALSSKQVPLWHRDGHAEATLLGAGGSLGARSAQGVLPSILCSTFFCGDPSERGAFLS